nr:hypothetical protein [Tanacetum cinerariifolium]
MSLSAKIRMHAEYNIKERRRLNSIVEEKDALLKAKDEEIGSLKAQLILKEAEAAKVVRLRAKTSNFEAVEKSLLTSVEVKEQEVVDLDVMVTSVKLQNDNLVDHVHKLKTSSTGLQEKVTAYENCLSRLEKFQDDRMREMNDKFDKLDANIVEMALHLEEKFYPHILTTISGPAIGKAVKKGMQDGLSAEITHGAEGRVLTDVAAYNPSAEANCLSALQHDYEVMHVEGEKSIGADANPFPGVDDAELNIPQ